MAKTHHDSPAGFADPLDHASIGAIISGMHGAPFDVLGSHVIRVDGRPAWVVRAFLPGAESAWVVPTSPVRGRQGETALAPTPRARRHGQAAADGRSGGSDGAGTRPRKDVDAAPTAGAPARIPMQLLHPAGLFSAVVPPSPARGEDPPSYVLEARQPGGAVERSVDPYTFPPLLSDFDLHLIGEGKHHEIYDRLGARPRQVNGVSGVAFAVWAPNARRVSVVGDFNGWDERANPMRLRSGGIWELFIPGLAPDALYKYAVLSWNRGHHVLKADPYAFWAEVRPETASRVYDLSGYRWNDAAWVAARGERNGFDRPILVYELHLGSWRPSSSPGGAPGLVSYRDLAHQLVPYMREMGYTHVELLPVAEHPFDGSWGYQVTGYYAPTSRFGTPHDFMHFVDYLHQHDIGVIVDWVPAHFPKDEHGLAFFDGSHLYEHADPRQGEQRDWGTYVFNVGRNEVRNFLVANALFWIDKYHVDGLRVDAVAAMLYLDYGRKPGEWLPNRYGGHENLEAIAFLREFNSLVHERYPGTLTIAEESTAWPKVTHPVREGGLGFSLKWNMGWMHDILEYMHQDPIYRTFHHNQLTFSFTYAFSERFILPFSHDEVVHMKGSLLNKMPGDRWQRFANLRALYALMTAHPGKKLLFMGGELAQWSEWNYAGFLDWWLLEEPLPDGPEHRQIQRLVHELNAMVRAHPALYERDFAPEGFAWIDGSNAEQSVIAFMRYGAEGSDPLLFVGNFTPVPHYGYRVGVPSPGYWEEVLNTDAAGYGGSNVGNLGGVESEPVPMHGRAQSLALTLPPLAMIALRPASPAGPLPPAEHTSARVGKRNRRNA
jgi:1,4-alpha-glucan branching enzyme